MRFGADCDGRNGAGCAVRDRYMYCRARSLSLRRSRPGTPPRHFCVQGATLQANPASTAYRNHAERARNALPRWCSDYGLPVNVAPDASAARNPVRYVQAFQERQRRSSQRRPSVLHWALPLVSAGRQSGWPHNTDTSFSRAVSIGEDLSFQHFEGHALRFAMTSTLISALASAGQNCLLFQRSLFSTPSPAV